MGRAWVTARWALVGLSAVLTAYLAAVAMGASPIWGFGRTGSVPTILVTVVVIAGAVVLSLRARSARPGTIPVGVIAGLGVSSALLALASYGSCSAYDRPKWITALLWTATVVRGGVEDRSVNGAVCPAPTPVALEIARLAGTFAVFIGVVSVAVALLQTQWDRTRVRFAKSVTVIVDLDDDARPMVAAIARTLETGSQLAVLVPTSGVTAFSDLRTHRARVLEADFGDASAWASQRWWHRIDKLYLLSADASSNLLRLNQINALRSSGRRQRLPLIVRIDDPWQAQSWRAQQMGQSDTRWLADAVSKYELTAIGLLDRLLSSSSLRTIVVCGSSPLTLALCADVARRAFERSYFSTPNESPLPAVTLVSMEAEEYRADFIARQRELGLPSPAPWVTAAGSNPSMRTLEPIITAAEAQVPGSVAVVMVDGANADPTLATRLAARFPMLPLLAWDAKAVELQNVPAIIGQLQEYRVTMNVEDGQAQDVWERAARLIHTYYSSNLPSGGESAKPWDELDEFYRGSNRRLVYRALWMVESIAEHTWDAFAGYELPAAPADHSNESLARLAAIGFDRRAAKRMAKDEHEDWCRYYRAQGWQYAEPRDEVGKRHEMLVPWPDEPGEGATLEQRRQHDEHPVVARSLKSIAETLYALRELGYRSRPVWRRYRRQGVVTAEQRAEPWSWTTTDGQVLNGKAGDWSVTDTAGHSWSVRDDVFHSTYRHVAANRWERTGFVEARAARAGETLETLEGPVTAPPGSWVLRGQMGEEWPVSADRFAMNYSGAVKPADGLPN